MYWLFTLAVKRDQPAWSGIDLLHHDANVRLRRRWKRIKHENSRPWRPVSLINEVGSAIARLSVSSIP